METMYLKSGYFVATYTNGKKWFSMSFKHTASNNLLSEAQEFKCEGWELASLNLCKTKNDADALREYWDVCYYRNHSYLNPCGYTESEGVEYPYYMRKDRLAELLRERA